MTAVESRRRHRRREPTNEIRDNNAGILLVRRLTVGPTANSRNARRVRRRTWGIRDSSAAAAAATKLLFVEDGKRYERWAFKRRVAEFIAGKKFPKTRDDRRAILVRRRRLLRYLLCPVVVQRRSAGDGGGGQGGGREQQREETTTNHGDVVRGFQVRTGGQWTGRLRR